MPSGRFENVPLPFTSSSSTSMPLRKPTVKLARLPSSTPSDPSPGDPSTYAQTPGAGPSRAGPSLRRGKTLTRPERHVAPVPLVAPPVMEQPTTERDWWRISSLITTFWAPPALLGLCGVKGKESRQAWREKVTLCWIAILLGAVVGFVTMGLQKALCPEGETGEGLYQRLGTHNGTVSISGWVFNITKSKPTEDVNFYNYSSALPGLDVTNLFTRTLTDYPSCKSKSRYASTPLCAVSADPTVKETGTLQACPLPKAADAEYATLDIQNTTFLEGYQWTQVARLSNYMVMDGYVLNMVPYIAANPKPIAGDEVDLAIRTILNDTVSGKDATRLFYNRAVLREAIPCLQSRYLAGRIDKISPGCFVASLFLYTSLTVILGVVFIRFAMACVFNWFLSSRLVIPPKEWELARKAISPAVMPEGANVSVNNKTGTAPWSEPSRLKKGQGRNVSGKSFASSASTLVNSPALAGSGSNGAGAEPLISLQRIGVELFTVCLVTCYSEGEESVRGTIESIAATNYSDQRKLIWIVCDGMITGAGEKRSTPDICVGMLDADPRFGNPMPMGYVAVGSGPKRENRGMVYAGHYVSKNGHRTPTIIVVKCGMPGETKDEKPGNRGKRDSQLILMNFFSAVTYNDRMNPLDFDLFRKVQTLMGVTPDYFEVVLMVDADTRVYPDSLKHLINCMHRDPLIMGVCGETRVANKRQSWVTMIQVYEYFISHHLIKAFESVFGGVTCLPGCFSMYRIKGRKEADNDWVPILVKPEIVREYASNEVTSLHQKNLLLLGEDRFLTTIMLRTFPYRKNIFLPQAKCRTLAPETFSVLLSQRRRWINSTVHNLMELVRVRNLCGTFCFSMQFVVFMDLVGTVVLPIAICLTAALIVNSIITPPKSFQEAIPLMLLAAVLGLPAILILITTRKAIYVAWMFCYLLALPIWNFVLPVYSFWHFDDFSWGETRRVEGEIRSKKGHDDKTAVFNGTSIPLRRWEDWERSRLRKIRREEKRRRDFERQFGAGFHGDMLAPDGYTAPRGAWTKSEYEGSDTNSIFSSEDDIWGAEIGAYNENNPAFPPPPIALPPESNFGPGWDGGAGVGGLGGPGGGDVVGMDEMQAMLEEGWDEPVPSGPQRTISPVPRSQGGFSPTVDGQGQGSQRFALSDMSTTNGSAGRSGNGYGYPDHAHGQGHGQYPNAKGYGYTDTYVPSSNGHYPMAPPVQARGFANALDPPSKPAGYEPRTPDMSQFEAGAESVSTSVQRGSGGGHAHRRSGGRGRGGDGGAGYGPLGPLDVGNEQDDADGVGGGWGNRTEGFHGRKI